jgi:hypothetical protein
MLYDIEQGNKMITNNNLARIWKKFNGTKIRKSAGGHWIMICTLMICSTS